MSTHITDLRPQETGRPVRVCFLLPRNTSEKLEAIKEDYRNNYHTQVTRTSLINLMIDDYISRLEEDPTIIEGVL